MVREDRVCWWLTRESGRVPVGCVHGTVGEVRPAEVRKAYVAVQVSAGWGLGGVQWSEVVFGLLSREALFVVETRVVKLALRVWEGVVQLGVRGGDAVACWCREARWLVCLLDSGGFSTGFSCGCVLSSVCGRCAALPVGGRRFVEQDRFSGVFPRGRLHWWSGVTDAVKGSVCQAGCFCDGV
ncbi:hypothetical protein K458DRAFT_206683 [Lentithecium fluviatile CBS 122367]|uniref:Uncharacterized protein n=1 Tax=Lentithecium fluviatile CBS 122367 TaxID=1168545 RepID=A0A6G1IBR2_9PLEO|nr:hypothetical protein K458DRAFT_206683 [Lentithecium fluviatile CBS 122367]